MHAILTGARHILKTLSAVVIYGFSQITRFVREELTPPPNFRNTHSPTFTAKELVNKFEKDSLWPSVAPPVDLYVCLIFCKCDTTCLARAIRHTGH